MHRRTRSQEFVLESPSATFYTIPTPTEPLSVILPIQPPTPPPMINPVLSALTDDPVPPATMPTQALEIKVTLY